MLFLSHLDLPTILEKMWFKNTAYPYTSKELQNKSRQQVLKC